MLVATLMVIAVSGYAEEEFVPDLTEDFNNYSDGNIGNWTVWGNNNPTYHIVAPNGDGKDKCIQLINPSNTTDFWKAQLGYNFDRNLDPSMEYEIRFKVKCKNGNSQLQFQYQNNQDYNNQGGWQTISNITTEWTEVKTAVRINLGGNDKINRIVINFGQNQDDFYIDDIVFGHYQEVKVQEPGTTPTGSLNNTMYYDGTQWCLMLEDFEGETIGETKGFEREGDSKGTATVVADPHGKSKKSLNFITGQQKSGDYYYIDVTLPNSKKLSSTYFEKLIFDIVYNNTGDNYHKHFKVKIDNTSNQLGEFVTDGNPNRESWETKTFDLTGKYTESNTFRIYIGGESAYPCANMFIDNIRLSVKATANGTCGSPTPEKVNWMLDGNTLYISGTGDIADYEESNSKLWSDYKDNISNAIIGEGITAIGKQNFYDYNGLESVVLPSTLEKIGDQGLYVNNGNNETKPTFTFHSNPTMAADALNKNSSIATLVLDDALSPFFEATSENTFNGGIQYKRTLSAEKSTITLPFTPKSGSANCKFYKLSSASENNLTFEEVSKTNLVAGNPYIMVKTEGSNEIDFSTDESTIIPANAKASDTTSGPWTMHGTYSTIEKGSGDNAYGFTGNYLRKNTGTMTVKPFRAYFTTPSTTAKDYLDVIFGGEVTGIERNEFSPEGITEIFSLDGKKHDCLQKGMNIVKMNNGSIKKIVIK